MIRSVQAWETIGDCRFIGWVIVFSVKRGRPSFISNHGSFELVLGPDISEVVGKVAGLVVLRQVFEELDDVHCFRPCVGPRSY